jgi:hypothetical protein
VVVAVVTTGASAPVTGASVWPAADTTGAIAVVTGASAPAAVVMTGATAPVTGASAVVAVVTTGATAVVAVVTTGFSAPVTGASACPAADTTGATVPVTGATAVVAALTTGAAAPVTGATDLAAVDVADDAVPVMAETGVCALGTTFWTWATTCVPVEAGWPGTVAEEATADVTGAEPTLADPEPEPVASGLEPGAVDPEPGPTVLAAEATVLAAELVVAGNAEEVAGATAEAACETPVAADVTGAELGAAEPVVAGAVPEPLLPVLVVPGEPVVAAVTAEVTDAAAEVAAEAAEVTGDAADGTAEVPEVSGDDPEVAGEVDACAGVKGGEAKVAAFACRENTRKITKSPAATMATCSARRAMRRTIIGCGMSSSQSPGTGLGPAALDRRLETTSARNHLSLVIQNRTLRSVTTVQLARWPGKSFWCIATSLGGPQLVPLLELRRVLRPGGKLLLRTSLRTAGRRLRPGCGWLIAEG